MPRKNGFSAHVIKKRNKDKNERTKDTEDSCRVVETQRTQELNRRLISETEISDAQLGTLSSLDLEPCSKRIRVDVINSQFQVSFL